MADMVFFLRNEVFLFAAHGVEYFKTHQGRLYEGLTLFCEIFFFIFRFDFTLFLTSEVGLQLKLYELSES